LTVSAMGLCAATDPPISNVQRTVNSLEAKVFMEIKEA
jgi:hypothetical protein